MRTEAEKKVFVSMKWKELGESERGGERRKSPKREKEGGWRKASDALHDDVCSRKQFLCMCNCLRFQETCR